MILIDLEILINYFIEVLNPYELVSRDVSKLIIGRDVGLL